MLPLRRWEAKEEKKKDSDAGMREKCNRKKDRCSSYVFVVSRPTNVFLFILHKDQISGINHILRSLEVRLVCVRAVCLFVCVFVSDALICPGMLPHPQIQISQDKEHLQRCSGV